MKKIKQNSKMDLSAAPYSELISPPFYSQQMSKGTGSILSRKPLSDEERERVENIIMESRSKIIENAKGDAPL